MDKRILIIDDEEVIRKIFILALEDTGYIVDTADYGEKGVELVAQQKYDLIFLDMNMPGINGLETLRKIRKIDKQVVVYFVTAFYGIFFDELDRAQKDGLRFEVLKKPVGMAQIEMLARSVLEGSIER